MPNRISRSTILLPNSPSILASAAVGGKKEGEGPLREDFDLLSEDTTFGEKTWEKAEMRMQMDAESRALKKAGLHPEDIDVVFAGDLLNQCISSAYSLRGLAIPYIGLYGACSTMAESLMLASLFVDGGIARRAMAVTSSHFCTAERQFRFPLEYGGQRTPTAQWTATASGCLIVGEKNEPPYARAVCVGKIGDLGIKDLNNMGAAMAPAAADTLKTFFQDTGTSPENYDRIFTGDLGQVGSDLLYELMEREGIPLKGRHDDCGLLLYDRETQDVHAGGSGCGCSAGVLCGHILKLLKNGTYENVLFMATGALMSPTSVQQGESIPGIAHLVHLSRKPQ